MLMAVAVAVAMVMAVMIVTAALCARNARFVRVLLVQAMGLAVASGHPMELSGGNLARRLLST